MRPVANRARPTLRCLVDDLGLQIPPLDIDLGSLEEPMVGEARRVAPDSPRGQKRILAIKSPLVYRLRHGALRGATWVDRNDALWLLAVERRKEDSDDDAFEYFTELHGKGRLLPTRDDELRLHAEEAAQFLLALREDVVALCTEATFNLEFDLTFNQERILANRIPARIRAVPGAVHEIWLAISVRDVAGVHYPPQWRDLVFAVVEQELQPDEWEWATEFAGVPLVWHEIGRLYLRS